MVSGRYFLPKAPLLWWKEIPACAVTSVNWIGPEGRLADSLLGAGELDGAGSGAAAAFGCGVRAADSGGAGFCLQPKQTSKEMQQRMRVVFRDSIFKFVFGFLCKDSCCRSGQGLRLPRL